MVQSVRSGNHGQGWPIRFTCCRGLPVMWMVMAATAPAWAQVADTAPSAVPPVGGGDLVAAQPQDEAPKVDPSERLEVPPVLQGIDGIEPGMTVLQWLEAGRRAKDREQWSDAIKILVQVVRLQPQNLDALMLLAFCYERSAAQKRSDPSDPDGKAKADRLIAEAIVVYLHAAPVATAIGQPMIAEKMLDQVLRYQPDNPQALITLGRLLGNTGRGLMAIERYKQYVATEAGKQDPKAYLELGQLYRAFRYLNHAIGALRNAQKYDPQSTEIMAEIALALLDSKEYDEAMKTIEEVIARSPKVPEYRHIQALAFISTRKLQEASTAARQAIELARKELQETPEDVAKLRELGNYYDTYASTLRSILTVDQTIMEVRIDLARVLQERADVRRALSFHEALDVLRTASEAGQNNIRWLEAMAEVQYQVFQYEGAFASCQQLLKLDPGNATAGRIVDAIPDRYKKAPESQPAGIGS